MRTDFTNLRNALDNLLAVMEHTAADLLGTANQQRRELVELYARMSDTQADISEFGEMMSEAAGAFDDISDVCSDTAVKITDAIESGCDRVPECNYEDLVEFCDECGRAIVDGENYDCTASGWYICADHLPAEDDGEQLELDIPETDVPVEA